MATVEFHPAAKDEYDESFDWYAKRSVRAALGFAAEVSDASVRIAKSPEQFPDVDSVHRECRHRRYPFRVIFRSHGKRTVVIAVAHAKRRPDYWRNRILT
jgi:plasmid stabilization system protein ParE